jgi:hypothetical protein
MRERFAKDYAEMDRACEDFTETERSVGVFFYESRGILVTGKAAF